MSNIGKYIGFSCGPAQLLAPIVLPGALIYGTVQKIRALLAEKKDKYLNHQHDPVKNEECIYSAERHTGNHGNGYKACPFDEVDSLKRSATRAYKLFVRVLVCIVPVLGGLLAHRIENPPLWNPGKTYRIYD